eukprot:1995135-Amphidinium_carterae.1
MRNVSKCDNVPLAQGMQNLNSCGRIAQTYTTTIALLLEQRRAARQCEDNLHRLLQQPSPAPRLHPRQEPNLHCNPQLVTLALQTIPCTSAAE